MFPLRGPVKCLRRLFLPLFVVVVTGLLVAPFLIAFYDNNSDKSTKQILEAESKRDVHLPSTGSPGETKLNDLVKPHPETPQEVKPASKPSINHGSKPTVAPASKTTTKPPSIPFPNKLTPIKGPVQKPPLNQKQTTQTMARLVHLDLKGAAPRLEYLRQVLPVWKQWGATGLLVEYEDMFPYSGDLKVLARPTAYTRPEISTLQQLARDTRLDVIPLLQTFGHMEFVLKHEQFKHLRESPQNKGVINCLKPEALSLIKKMIDQVLVMHPNVTVIHIGSNEVGVPAASPESQDFMRTHKTNRGDLFIKHVENVAAYVKQKYSRIRRSIIWHDGLINTTLSQVQKSSLPNLVEPMVWIYNKNTWTSLNPGFWENLAKVFPNIWVASAFKGASGKRQIAVPIENHIENQLSWMNTIQEHLSGRFKKIQGVALTGRQRYTHFDPLCELLPVALPSLAINLKLLSIGHFDQGVLRKAEESLKCDSPLELTLKKSKTHCQFPGSVVFDAILRLNYAKYLCYKVMQKSKVEPYKLLFQHYSFLYKELQALEGIFHKELSKIFYQDTEREFIDYHVYSLKTSLNEFYKQAPKASSKPKT